MVDYISMFFDQFDKFIGQIFIKTQDPEFLLYKRLLQEIKSKEEKQEFINIFYDLIRPYQMQIKNQDEHFFLSKFDVSAYADTPYGQEATDIFAKLKTYLQEGIFSVKDKATIWQYLHVLFLLSEKAKSASPPDFNFFGEYHKVSCCHKLDF